jgi:hypothetical protein
MGARVDQKSKKAECVLWVVEEGRGDCCLRGRVNRGGVECGEMATVDERKSQCDEEERET